MLIFERVFEKGVINKKLKKSSWKNKGVIKNYKNKSALENENEPSKKFKKSRSKK